MVIAASALGEPAVLKETQGSTTVDSSYVRGTMRALCSGFSIRDWRIEGFRVVSDCDSPVVSYISLERKWHFIIQPISVNAPRPVLRLTPASPSFRFHKSGSISRAATFGTNEDFSLESSLNFEAYGKIGRDYTVRAVLSDRASPIQPEGNTATLSELDRVYVELMGPYLSSRFGDVDISLNRLSLLPVVSSVRGVVGRVSYSPAGLYAVSALFGGEYRRMLFTGVEGRQGPYQLTSSDGSSDITVIAGSERVYVDGKPLGRGEDADYTMDYNAAYITFTPNVPITGNSRIIVEFTYTRSDYQSELYCGESYLKPIRYLTLSVAGYSLRDQRGNPLTGDFTDEDISGLRELGDRTDSAFVSGASETPGAGAYSRRDSAGTIIYDYVGDSLGDWTVVFTLVGDSSGSYSPDTSGDYVYVGAGNGNYEPLRAVSLPSALSELAIGFSVDSLPFIQAEGEIASTDKDKNTFSPLDDDDNIGGAKRIKIVFPLTIGSFSLDGGYTFLSWDNRFSPPQGFLPPEYNRDWGIQGNRDSVGSTVHSGSVSLSTPFGGKMRLELGQRKDSDALSALRIVSSVGYDGDKLLEQIRISGTESDVDEWGVKSVYRRGDGFLKMGFWRFCPSLSLESERRAGADTSGYTAGEGEIGISLGKKWKLAPGIGLRTDSKGNLPYSDAEHYRIVLTGSYLSVALYRRSFDAIAADAGSDLVTTMADITGHHSFGLPSISISGSYRLTGNQRERREKSYRYVGVGNGDYEYDAVRGEYVISSGGDYLLEYRGTGVFYPTNDIKGSGRATLSSRGLLPSAFGDISLSISSSLEQSYSGTGSSAFVPLVSRFFGDTLLLMESFNATISGIWRLSLWRAEAGEGQSKRVDRLLSSGVDIYWQQNYWATIQRELNIVRIKSRFDRTESGRQSAYSGYQSDIRKDQLTLNIEASKGKIVPSISGKLIEGESFSPVYSVTGISIEPACRVVLGKLLLDARFSGSSFKTDGTAGILPYEMASGDLVGTNLHWSLNGSITALRGGTFTLTYTGEHLADIPVKHTLRMEVRYSF